MQAQFTFGMAALGFSLGLRHGIDWDHIAAISDITGSTVQTESANDNEIASDSEADAKPKADIETRTASIKHTHSAPGSQEHSHTRYTVVEALWLATYYALGHGLMVVGLGLLAIWASEFVPAWFDPLMERVVGLTLLVLGFWVFYSLWRFGSSFRLQSRWMVVFGLGGRAWRSLYRKFSGRAVDAHEATHEFMQYGPLAAFLIGVVHGFGAETGSQALLLGTVAGATSRETGSLLLFAFVIGLLVSNSLVAAFSVATFISTKTRQKVYVGVGILVGLFSLFVGAFFITGHGDSLPDLQKAMEGGRAASSSKIIQKNGLADSPL